MPFKVVALLVLFSIVFNLFAPTVAFALTAGPSQPEVQSFEPVGTSDMVDLFTGDFNYNIPLLDVDGYPLNISYHAGINMDQEASWVGLGWNINAGVVNRNMRGLPDDFNGDKIEKEIKMKPNETVGFNFGLGGEILALDPGKLKELSSIGGSVGINYNNYNGIGFEISANASISSAGPAKGGLNCGLGLRSSSSEGLTISPSLSYSKKIGKYDGYDRSFGGSVGVDINRRAGVKQINLGLHQSQTKKVLLKTDTRTSGGVSGAVTFGAPTFVPASEHPMENTSITLSAKVGSNFFFVDGFYSIAGYYSSQRLLDNHRVQPAYGYLNTDNGASIAQALTDFNRENDIGFSENTPALPVTNFTYDVYAVSGQGIGGAYRPYRSDIGSLGDSYTGSVGSGANIGAEFAMGGVAKGGVDYIVNSVITTTGKWEDDNQSNDKLRFKTRSGVADKTYEPYYFKSVGEMSVDEDQEFYEKIGGDKAVALLLEHNSKSKIVKGSSYLRSNTGPSIQLPEVNYRTKRAKKNQPIAFLTYTEAKILGLQKELYASSGFNKVFSNSKNGHHIAEFTTYKTDGNRYVYGIPAYNTYQEETSFAVGKSNQKSSPYTPDCVNGLIQYDDEDNSMANLRSVDNYFSKTVMPAYAHSYLLTAVLSPEYVDADAVSGPSNGDFGNYTLFKYDKLANYKWRTPYESYKANYNERLKTTKTDDQANYIYGEKELWYLKTIESKNHIAVFTTEDRKDGFGVQNKNGGRGTTTTKLLRKISLYAIDEYKSNPETAVPIKEVHFEYDYSLCPNVPNNNEEEEIVNGVDLNANKGKLTLKKIYFTYGNSKKGRLSPYKFYYREDVSDYNPSYNFKANDRWGNYKPNTTSDCDVIENFNAEFPYVNQDSVEAAKNSSAWSMSRITLPSGGKIEISYESDDYAYVQDSVAMQMFKLVDIRNTSSPGTLVKSESLLRKLFEITNYTTKATNENMYFFYELTEPIPGDNFDIPKFKQQYLRNLNRVYFNFLVNIGYESMGRYEFVRGYANLASGTNFGLYSDGTDGTNNTHFWVKLAKINIGDNENLSKDVNPISKAAWQFGRLNAPTVVWNNEEEASNLTNIKDVAKKFEAAGVMKNIIDFIKGPNRVLMHNGCGMEVIPYKSYMKFYNPVMNKYGGGLRVKKIAMKDAWNTMASGGGESEYGQEYYYNTTLQDGTEISSGVASYEPLIGGDENSLKQPIFWNAEKLLAPDDEHYLEEPLGESYYPAGVVGYSKVVVRNIQHENVVRNATGHTEYCFYTAKDFPVKATRTNLDPIRKRSNPILRILKIVDVDFMTVSQGFAVELNDMHGKQKSIKHFAQGQTTEFSSVTYKYKSIGQKLDNRATVIYPNGDIKVKNIGVEVDFVNDLREQETITQSGGITNNLTSFLAAIFPAIVPIPLPTASYEQTRFRSSVMTKVINRTALLDSVVVTDQSASVATQNLAYDSETGQVLVTRTINSHDDDVYSMNFPAHWAYDEMGPASKNLGLELITNIYGHTIINSGGYFVKGDELLIRKLSTNEIKKAWVYDIINGALVSLIDSKGDFFSLSTGLSNKVSIKIIRSGRRNLQQNSIASVMSLRNPLDANADGRLDDKITNLNSTFRILSASAIEYSNEWKTYCGCNFGTVGNISMNSTNPFINGTYGNWFPKKSYTYLTDRTQTNFNNNTNIRKDGTLVAYSPFWTVPSGGTGAWLKNDVGWTWTSEVTLMSPNGNELENKDALERYSSAHYGYRFTLPVNVAANAPYHEVGTDNFEDYYAESLCWDNHFRFLVPMEHVVTTQSHTGIKSIRVPYNIDTIRVLRQINPCD